MKIITFPNQTQVSVFDEINGGIISFRCNRELTKEEAEFCQEKMNKHPMAHDFFWPKGCSTSKTWECLRSSD
jgi:hypothetical protein